MTPLIAEGVPYVVSVAEDTITQILASDPAKPKVVSSATISRGPPDGSGSTSPGFDKLYTSLLPETICVVDVVAPQYDARCMAHSGTPGSMDAVVSGGALYLVSATDAPGASIRAGSLEEVLSVRTGDAPADIGAVDAYGTAYVLVAADVLYAFDMSGDVIYKGVDGPYVSLDVAAFGGSTYAALPGHRRHNTRNKSGRSLMCSKGCVVRSKRPCPLRQKWSGHVTTPLPEVSLQRHRRRVCMT